MDGERKRNLQREGGREDTEAKEGRKGKKKVMYFGLSASLLPHHTKIVLEICYASVARAHSAGVARTHSAGPV